MIVHKDQLDLFRLISSIIKADIVCYAFGGTAMMFYGYKDQTKDIDLLFGTEADRKEFIKAIEILGYKETSPIKIYIPAKLKDKHAPIMYRRGESRFDLFVSKIFRTTISPRMKDALYSVHDFKGKHTLTIKVLKTEFIVLLKGITKREKDFEDILTIVKKEQDFDWQMLIDETIWQYMHKNEWALYDVERTLRELKKYVFIESNYLNQLYRTAEKKKKIKT